MSVRSGANLREETMHGALIMWAMALTANMRLGWKGLPKTNNLAY